jgi:hypothetical protein
MKRSKREIPTRALKRPEQTWADVFEAIAQMREALERIAYSDAPKHAAREALRRFNSSITERK